MAEFTPPHRAGYDTWGSMPEDEWTAASASLMARIVGRDRADSVDDVRLLLRLHNQRFVPQQSNYHCGACVARCMQRMTKWYRKHLDRQAEIAAAEIAALDESARQVREMTADPEAPMPGSPTLQSPRKRRR